MLRQPVVCQVVPSSTARSNFRQNLAEIGVRDSSSGSAIRSTFFDWLPQLRHGVPTVLAAYETHKSSAARKGGLESLPIFRSDGFERSEEHTSELQSQF